MQKTLKSYLKTIPGFRNAYSKALEYVGENINPYWDTLELSAKTNCDVCFPLTEDNLYVLGLDTKKNTVWIFFDEYLADA